MTEPDVIFWLEHTGLHRWVRAISNQPNVSNEGTMVHKIVVISINLEIWKVSSFFNSVKCIGNNHKDHACLHDH